MIYGTVIFCPLAQPEMRSLIENQSNANHLEFVKFAANNMTAI